MIKGEAGSSWDSSVAEHQQCRLTTQVLCLKQALPRGTTESRQWILGHLTPPYPNCRGRNIQTETTAKQYPLVPLSMGRRNTMAVIQSGIIRPEHKGVSQNSETRTYTLKNKQTNKKNPLSELWKFKKQYIHYSSIWIPHHKKYTFVGHNRRGSQEAWTQLTGLL